MSSITFLEYVRAGGFFFLFFYFLRFFFSIKVKSYIELQLPSPNAGANKSTLPKNLFIQVLNQYYNVNKLKTTTYKLFLKYHNFSKGKKNLFLEFWKLGTVYFCTVKTFSQFSKIRGGLWRTTKNFFFFFWPKFCFLWSTRFIRFSFGSVNIKTIFIEIKSECNLKNEKNELQKIVLFSNCKPMLLFWHSQKLTRWS